MKKKRLSVRIDGVWYRVSHGKLHKISSHSNKTYAATREPAVETSVDDNIKIPSSMASAFKQRRHNTPAKSSSFSKDFRSQAIEERLCPQALAEPLHELGDAFHGYESSDESCMSTATSAKKSLVIKIRISKPKGL